MVCFVSGSRPFSIQSNGCERYKERLRNEFRTTYTALYPNLPLRDRIYSKLIYIHKNRTDIDVDNLSKPFVDAFKGLIYSDDNIINHRICSKINLEEFETLELQTDLLPQTITERLINLLETGSDHILYYEIDNFDTSMVKIGE